MKSGPDYWLQAEGECIFSVAVFPENNYFSVGGLILPNGHFFRTLSYHLSLPALNIGP